MRKLIETGTWEYVWLEEHDGTLKLVELYWLDDGFAWEAPDLSGPIPDELINILHDLIHSLEDGNIFTPDELWAFGDAEALKLH